MNTRFFIFSDRHDKYKTGDDYVRCNPNRSVIVAPRVGETDANDELSLDRCLSLAKSGILTEVISSLVGERASRQL
jgi:hypothetical protein